MSIKPISSSILFYLLSSSFLSFSSIYLSIKIKIIAHSNEKAETHAPIEYAHGRPYSAILGTINAALNEPIKGIPIAAPRAVASS